MHRAPDLLVEQDVAGKFADAVVQPKCQLTQVARAGVGVQHRPEEVLPLDRPRLRDFAPLEGELDPVHLTALEDRREREPHPAAGRILDRPGEHLAVWTVLLPRGLAPGPAGHRAGTTDGRSME